jgi:hypothetical protein
MTIGFTKFILGSREGLLFKLICFGQIGSLPIGLGFDYFNLFHI